MDLLPLRLLLSEAHAEALEGTGLLDRVVLDPLLEERMHRIRTQLTAALGLRSLLVEAGSEDLPDQLMDLAPLVEEARTAGLLRPKAAAVLHQLNREAIDAKHALAFVPRAGTPRWSRIGEGHRQTETGG